MSRSILRELNPSNLPAEWDSIDRELYFRLQPDKYGLYTPEQYEAIRRIREARWLLVENERRETCTRCGSIHRYLTILCIERPFEGYGEVQLFEQQIAQERGLLRGENIIQTIETYLDIYLGKPVPITEKDAARYILRIQSKPGGRKLILSIKQRREIQAVGAWHREQMRKASHGLITRWEARAFTEQAKARIAEIRGGWKG